jgi:hypothetical protein
MRLNTSKQLFDAEGLDHIVIATYAKCQDLISIFLFSAEEEDGDTHLFAQVFTYGESIALRQHDIKDHEVWVMLTRKAQRKCAVQGRIDLIAFVFERIPDKLHNLGFVVNDQDNASRLLLFR